MKREITFWKNQGHEALRGRTVELFKVSWDDRLRDWVRDEDGPYWGMYKLDTQEVRRLNRDPNDMGNVVKVKETGDVTVFTQVVEEKGVDHLEAEDISITPEGLDLGEDE